MDTGTTFSFLKGATGQLKSLIFASAGRCVPLSSPWTSLCAGDIGQDSPFVNMSRPTSAAFRCAWLQRDTELVARFPLGGRVLLMLAGWIRRIPRRWTPSTVCAHNPAAAPQPVHTTVLPPP